jgi:hypothetical protein
MNVPRYVLIQPRFTESMRVTSRDIGKEDGGSDVVG